MTPEGKVKAKIKKFLKDNTLQHWMIIPSAFGATTGVSDFIGILPNGRFFAIEAKAEGKKPTAIQQKFLKAIEDNQGISIVVAGEHEVEKLKGLINA